MPVADTVKRKVLGGRFCDGMQSCGDTNEVITGGVLTVRSLEQLALPQQFVAVNVYVPLAAVVTLLSTNVNELLNTAPVLSFHVYVIGHACVLVPDTIVPVKVALSPTQRIPFEGLIAQLTVGF